MDFGFIRATDTNFGRNTPRNKTPTDRVVQFVRGYSTYLLIVDTKTQYTWVFLFKTKHRPITVVTTFLNKFAFKSGFRAICVDQGGELAKLT